MYNLAFYGCLATLAIGGALGVTSIWLPEEHREMTAKLMATDGIMFVTSLAVAIVTKLLG